MSILDEICAAARRHRTRIVLSEGDDSRVAEAALKAARDGIADMQLIGPRASIHALLADNDGADRIDILDPAESPKLDRYTHEFFELRKHKGMTREEARTTMSGQLGFAAMMVRLGDSDGTIGGAVATTTDTVRIALQVIGKSPEASVVSSCFLMSLRAPFNQSVIFADCGLILQPTAVELASIAIASAQSLSAFTGQTPRVAMLSFSTMGSVRADAHESIDRIRTAILMIREQAPDLNVDGEMQFDAALMPDVGDQKAPNSQVAGQANVFVFPSLSAGNIAYKIAHRLGGASALGPILQGLAKPANDLSRGCSVEDIYRSIAITACQAIAQREAKHV
ncbi:phosphate acetyltransferase [Sedimentitalea todarodis]|uniref:Phosphate acetyltransferase n=1 Tax=Sedimentitalea todarodis TaxID=1631240 RepID=A0ABU3VDS4_9RHOB|nr:phosphate acetyltransferase [Sedimentitalea todarodis]MDU9004335.1 phosphate acetyltransferase [Sedimentitalea todarodis]